MYKNILTSQAESHALFSRRSLVSTYTESVPASSPVQNFKIGHDKSLTKILWN